LSGRRSTFGCRDNVQRGRGRHDRGIYRVVDNGNAEALIKQVKLTYDMRDCKGCERDIGEALGWCGSIVIFGKPAPLGLLQRKAIVKPICKIRILAAAVPCCSPPARYSALAALRPVASTCGLARLPDPLCKSHGVS
jgi:hypothetical protein